MYGVFNEKRLKHLSEEIERIRFKMHGIFNIKLCLSDPEVKALSKELDCAVIRYQEYIKRLT
ncbi:MULTISPECIES: aspartyl-phosphate phosphatase Spo0E family protein [Paenibacillus]|uniref:Spo0E-like regulatory phosphatase n=1 Tax=Paenibacillus naphthalenovorans TaxID=162209 RepID=A0A0U2VZP0_9BACL|nr:Spo0E-like regulatory phosphatase [Paenibacillus naphthalenovorans]NTZ16492.1 aspartyl-phosphate phosphatase Spo0E family protein [Paenibacillus sp. JMULE4]GCL71476.1 Spo0E family sporulation regulatory protein-aspartic acid phosphatase [Paenibacillus naphthalenovorans]SDI84276.1 Spo0E like sporulation regulatory protein [Paenibacillus naphthalenovorans]